MPRDNSADARPDRTSSVAYAAPAARGVGPINAPMIHRNGKKKPIQKSQ